MGHDDASSAYLVYFASTNRTRVVGTPTFIEDVDAYASRLIDSTSVPALPVDPTELFYDKPAPFHDTVTSEVSFDVIGLGAWYSQEDHELIALLQLRPAGTGQRQGNDGAATSSSLQIQTAALSGPLSLGTCLTRATFFLLVSRLCALPSRRGGTTGLWGASTLSFLPTP